jgi:D-alanine-D-alanine ligase
VKKLRIGVVYGGRSSEHEVSVASAASILRHLDRERYEPIPILIGKDGCWKLPSKPPSTSSAGEVIELARRHVTGSLGREAHLLSYPCEEALLAITRSRTAGDGLAEVRSFGLDVVFPALHGPYGEDGAVQGLFELAGLPYVGAGVLASAAAMDKAVMKTLFAARGLPIPAHMVVARREWRSDPAAVSGRVLECIGLPLFVKPANMGSSIGIVKVKEEAALGAALDHAAEFDTKLMVESAVPGARDIECSVLGNSSPSASLPGEVIPSREFYDYEAKYLDESELLIPASLTPEQAEEVQRLALEAFVAVDCAGMARVDFLMERDTGRIYVNEINTIPGFTTISMYPKLWEASGLEYPALIDRLVALALERHAERRDLRTSLV